jgi:predicted unusual protein kinase regulating ubiquinone biosynthesis (AarF/ABC1/UbiB family)
MNIIPENLKKYQKFISLVLKYRNSDILSAASDKALDELAEDQELSEDSNRYTSPEELVEDLKNMGPTYVKSGKLFLRDQIYCQNLIYWHWLLYKMM